MQDTAAEAVPLEKTEPGCRETLFAPGVHLENAFSLMHDMTAQLKHLNGNLATSKRRVFH